MSDTAVPVAIIGAGWAGLSCAHHLVNAGIAVTLLDAAPAPGGRARNARLTLAGQPVTLDNGQHLLIGAYRESLSLIEALGTTDRLMRMPMQIRSDRLALVRRGPGRIGLAAGFLFGSGLSHTDRAGLIRFGLTLGAQRWQCQAGETVQQLLERTAQTDTLIRHVWRPLCIGALNTEPKIACGQTFANVLHDALLLHGNGSDYLVSQSPLGALLANPMWADLQDRGATCLERHRVNSLTSVGSDQWRLETSNKPILANRIVMATPWHVAATLLAPLQPAASDAMAGMKAESIRTVYLAWDAGIKGGLPAIRMLTDDPANGDYGQWFFRRNDANIPDHLAMGAVVVSAADSVTVSADKLCSDVAAQISRQLGLPAPRDAICVNEKRATFQCTPDRPAIDHGSVAGHRLPTGLLLAGDYCTARYPATLESAVLSGRAAAQQIIGSDPP